MAYPDDPVPVVVEIAPGADPAGDPGDWVWEDITTSVRLEDRIRITVGRPDEATRVDPARCSLRLDNSTGDFVRRNPYGRWYGQLGRNTPLRVRIRRAEDTFGRTVSGGWGTADSGQAWTAAGGSASNYSVSGGTARHSHSSANTLFWQTLDTSLLDVEQLVDVSTSAMLTGGALVTGVVARRVGDTYYWLRCEFDKDSSDVVLKITRIVAGVFTDLATLDPVPSLAYAANTPLRVRASCVGDRLAIKAWTASATEPVGWQLEVTDDAITTPGAVGVQTWLVAGNTNPPPVVATVDNYAADVDRFSGYVSSWPARWDTSGEDATVPIEAAGILRRLGQGTPPIRSALRRTIAAAGPAAYWPGEDGEASAQLASAIPGHPPMVASGAVEFVSIADFALDTVTLRYGSFALVDLSGGARLAAAVPLDVTAATGGAWAVHILADVDPAVILADYVIAEWTTPGGSYRRWQVVVTPTESRVVAYTSTGAATTLLTGGLLGGLAAWVVTAEQSGGIITLRYEADFVYTTTFPGSLMGIGSVVVNPTAATASDQVTVGHVAIWAGDSIPYVTSDVDVDEYGQNILSARLSARYEPAHARLARLCAEDGVRVSIPAVDEYAATRMGWQAPGAALDLYRQCETADQGVLYEQGYGLAYLPRDGRYNRPVALALDYAAGHIAPPLEPADDDQAFINTVTVRRIDGSAATAQDAASVATEGPYETSVDVSLSAGIAAASDDDPLPDHASWRLRLGSVQEMRWPRISVSLSRSPELVDAVLSTALQSRVTVANPPDEVAGDAIDLIVEGYSEVIGYTDWVVDFNCSPASPWDVATVDGDQPVAADGSTLAADITAGALSLSLASTAANGVWTTSPSDFPLSLRIGGEQVTATAIAGTTSPQTVTLSARGVNGITRAWPAGTEVDVWDPAIVAL